MKFLLVFSLLATQAAFSSDKIFCGAWTRDQKTLEFINLGGKVMDINGDGAGTGKNKIELGAIDGATLSFGRTLKVNEDGTFSPYFPATFSVALRTKENNTMDPDIEAVVLMPKYEAEDRVSIMANGRINGKHIQIACFNSEFVK